MRNGNRLKALCVMLMLCLSACRSGNNIEDYPSINDDRCVPVIVATPTLVSEDDSGGVSAQEVESEDWGIYTESRSGFQVQYPRWGIVHDKIGLSVKRGDRGMVVYYPYFIAEKSGTIEIKPSGVIIEAVEKIYGIWLLSLNEMLRCTMI